MSGEVIDQDGQQQVYKAHFWRHYVEEWEEFDSPEDAISFLNNGEEWGSLSSRGVVWPDGTEREYDWVNDADGAIMLARVPSSVCTPADPSQSPENADLNEGAERG